MIAIDTNIWVYSHDTRDPNKQLQSQELIRTAAPLALPWQVGCEFIAASRKLEPFGFSQEDAWAALDDMCGMADAVLMPEPELWPATRLLQQQHNLSFWDALIVAAAREPVCERSTRRISAARETSTDSRSSTPSENSASSGPTIQPNRKGISCGPRPAGAQVNSRAA